MNQLIDAGMKIAVRAANEYLRVHKLQANNEALAECLKSWMKIKLPEALSDAKEAIACNTHQVAEQSFAASMALAGIEAAKEAGQPA